MLGLSKLIPMCPGIDPLPGRSLPVEDWERPIGLDSPAGVGHT